MLRDPPFSRLDLVSCRNVLIYFQPQLQRRLFSIFHYALNPEGLLVIAEEARATADEARTAAEAANLAKGSFLASMSHDLRTPLNAIVGYTELLELGLHGPVTDAQLADFARIRRSSWHLISLINDILNFAKLEAGHLEFFVTDVQVAALLSELDDLIAPQLAAKSLHYVRADCEVIVHADPEKLRQILLNLLSNAVKFTAAGGYVTIACETTGEHVRIAVSDTGCGIASDQLERVFEPFVQIGRSFTHPQEGTGLGLAISRELAHAMKGELTVESIVGEGSEFALTLPRAGQA